MIPEYKTTILAISGFTYSFETPVRVNRTPSTKDYCIYFLTYTIVLNREIIILHILIVQQIDFELSFQISDFGSPEPNRSRGPLRFGIQSVPHKMCSLLILYIFFLKSTQNTVGP